MRTLYEVHGAHEVNGQWIGRVMLIETTSQAMAEYLYRLRHPECFPVRIEQVYKVEVEVVSREPAR